MLACIEMIVSIWVGQLGSVIGVLGNACVALDLAAPHPQGATWCSQCYA